MRPGTGAAKIPEPAAARCAINFTHGGLGIGGEQSNAFVGEQCARIQVTLAAPPTQVQTLTADAVVAGLQHPDRVACGHRLTNSARAGDRFIGGAGSAVVDDDHRPTSDRPGETDSARQGGDDHGARIGE